MSKETLNIKRDPLVREAAKNDVDIAIIENKHDNIITIEFDTNKIEKVIKLKLCKSIMATSNELYEYAKCVIKGEANDSKQRKAKIGIGIGLGIIVLNTAASYTICRDISTELYAVGMLASAIATKNIYALGRLIDEKNMINHDKAYYSNYVEEEVTQYTK